MMSGFSLVSPSGWGRHRVIIGQDKIIEELLTVLFARGHALIIGVPGLVKTLLVKTLAGCLGWQFKRIQFTPDLRHSGQSRLL